MIGSHMWVFDLCKSQWLTLNGQNLYAVAGDQGVIYYKGNDLFMSVLLVYLSVMFKTKTKTKECKTKTKTKTRNSKTKTNPYQDQDHGRWDLYQNPDNRSYYGDRSLANWKSYSTPRPRSRPETARPRPTNTKTETKTMAAETYIKTQMVGPIMAIDR